MTFTTRRTAMYEQALKVWKSGKSGHVGPYHGKVINVKACVPVDAVATYEIEILESRTPKPQSTRVSSLQTARQMFDVTTIPEELTSSFGSSLYETAHRAALELEMYKAPTSLIFEVTKEQADNFLKVYGPKEDSMRVYEAVVVKLDEKDQPSEVLQTVAPFTAKSAEEARNQVRIDYALANKLSGKDAAALQVRVREFQAGL